MFSFNWIDVVIIALLFLAAWRGLHTNFWSQLLTIAGFFTGLLLTSWLLSIWLKPHLDPTNFAVVRTNCALIVAVFLAVVGNTLGYRVHFLFDQDKHRRTQQGLSIFVSVMSVLLAAWLIAASLGRLPFVTLSNSANNALIIQFLDRTLPTQPSYFSLLDRYVNPNSSPVVFSFPKNAPQSAKLPKAAALETQKAVEDSLVRITGFGCGGVVSGSGFVIAPDLIMTNAHVIAGVRRPVVKHKNDSFEAIPVSFDALKDIAILRVPNLNVPTLELATESIAKDTPVFILGYPNGNFSVSSGAINERVNAYGKSIYNTGLVSRDIYELYANIQHGSSGAPLVLVDGRVAGMIFAKSETAKNYGYALSAQSLSLSVLQAITSAKRVGTGVCTN